MNSTASLVFLLSQRRAAAISRSSKNWRVGSPVRPSAAGPREARGEADSGSGAAPAPWPSTAHSTAATAHSTASTVNSCQAVAGMAEPVASRRPSASATTPATPSAAPARMAVARRAR